MTALGTTGRLLLLVPTTSYRVGDFLKAAHRLGVEVAVGSNRRQVLEKYSHGRTVTLDFRQVEKGAEQIVAYTKKYPLQAIVPTDEATTLLAARASAVLDLPHNSLDSVAAAGNKHKFRARLAEAGLPTPAYTLVSLDEDPAGAARVTDYPCVLKPLALSASRGVIRADDPAAFVAAFRRIADILDQAHAGAGDVAGHILVEGYVSGKEVSLEGLLDAGRLNVLALFDKPDALEGPYFEETIYVTPSRLSALQQDEIVAATRRAVAALGLRHGPIHAELRVNDAGVWAIEVAARSIGGLCSRTLRFGAGIRLEELILRHALGLPIETTERERSAAGVMMIPIPRAGRLRQVNGTEDARAVPGVVELSITIPIGQEVVPLPEGDRYLGFIVARDRAPDGVEAALREAHRRLDLIIET